MIISRNPETGYWTEIPPGLKLTNVHNPGLCKGRGCAIHGHPSDHPLRDAPLNWRTDAGKLERMCEHGIGHDDYDAVAYQISVGANAKYAGRHGCDGCCEA